MMEPLYNDRVVLRSEGLSTRPHTDLNLGGDFILMCSGNKVKTKEKQLPNMMIHNHAKFAPLDFVNKKWMGNARFFLPKPNIPLNMELGEFKNFSKLATMITWFENN